MIFFVSWKEYKLAISALFLFPFLQTEQNILLLLNIALPVWFMLNF